MLALYIAAALVPAAILAGLWIRARGRLARLEARQKELDALSTRRGALETELSFLSWFVKEFPRFTRELQEERVIHSIPGNVNDFVVRTFDPEESLILIRRKSAASDPEKERQLIVAASTDKVARMGGVVTAGKGELGYVSETNRVLDRDDLKAVLPSLADRRMETLIGFKTDLAAPMTTGRGKSLGVIALSQPKRRSMYSKSILDLIAQGSALALSNAIALSQIRSQSESDPLTGVYNKGALTHRLQEELELAAETSTELSIFLMDIDHFKNYNDVNGHLAGDALLRELTEVVLEVIRAGDIFGRFGGEEFLLILPGRSAAIASFLADKLRERIAEHSFPFGNKQPLGKLTISGGVASNYGRFVTRNDLLSAADAALYEAKAAGRNHVTRARLATELELD